MSAASPNECHAGGHSKGLPALPPDALPPAALRAAVQIDQTCMRVPREGGVVGYDSNLETGGKGARYLGIGASTQYRVDNVTVAMRIVSVQTGEVLLTVACEKRIASYRTSTDVFRFIDMGVNAIELEYGNSVNEPINYAVRAAIESSVVEIVMKGERQGLWKFKNSVKNNNEEKQILPMKKPVNLHNEEK